MHVVLKLVETKVVKETLSMHKSLKPGGGLKQVSFGLQTVHIFHLATCAFECAEAALCVL